MRGALGPLLEKTIKEQLAYEHQVLEEGKPRIPVSCPTVKKKRLINDLNRLLTRSWDCQKWFWKRMLKKLVRKKRDQVSSVIRIGGQREMSQQATE